MCFILHLVFLSVTVLVARSASVPQAGRSCSHFCQQNGQFVCCNQVQPVVPTTGPSDCQFPFIYNGVTYTACTTNDDPDGKLWCSTGTDNRNNHLKGKFKHCQGSTSSVCQFPFIHKDVIYTACTAKDDPDGKPWCSTATDNRDNHIKGKWKHCEVVTPPPTTTSPPTTSSPLTAATSSLLPSQCGAVGDSDRIVGGTELRIQSFIWMAQLGFGQRNNPDWLCGGSLITERYVLTAAHCTTERPVVMVRLGEHDTSTASDCHQLHNNDLVCAPPVQDFLPEQIISHPSWTLRSRFSDDIALIRLDRKVQLNSYVQPICLPSHGISIGKFLRGREAEVAGWGATENGKLSHVKLVVKVPIQETDKCTDGNNAPLHGKGQLCFGAVDGKDSCSGDSGGPLVSTDPNAGSAYVLLGVVSYGPSDCGHTEPAVYTDVSHYRNWIENNLRP